MAELDELVKYWIADREAVSVLRISDIEFDFDEGWPGTDVTPGELPEVVIKYTVTRDVVYRRPSHELGELLMEFVSVAARGPLS